MIEGLTKRLIILSALAGLVGSLALASSSKAQTQTPALKQLRFRMDWVPSGIYGAFYYAQRRGFYAKEGLSVEILPGQGSNATIDGMLRGDLDFGFVSCWGMSVAVSNGREVQSIATFTGKNGFGFFTPKDANVKTLADLKGKRIVVSPASFDTLLIPAVLAANGLPDSTLERLNVDPAQKVPTYVRGQADVVVSHVPYAQPLIEGDRPSNFIVWSSVGFVMPDFCLAASKQKLATDKETIVKFLRATYAAVKEAEQKPDDVAAAAIELNPLLDRKKTAEQWRLMTSLFFTDETKSCQHGWHSAADWTKSLQALQTYGGLKGPIDDHSRFYTNEFFPCSK